MLRHCCRHRCHRRRLLPPAPAPHPRLPTGALLPLPCRRRTSRGTSTRLPAARCRRSTRASWGPQHACPASSRGASAWSSSQRCALQQQARSCTRTALRAPQHRQRQRLLPCPARTKFLAQRALSVTSVATTWVTLSLASPHARRPQLQQAQGAASTVCAHGGPYTATTQPCMHSATGWQGRPRRTLSASCHSGFTAGSLQSSGITRLNSTVQPASTACRAARSSTRTSAASASAAGRGGGGALRVWAAPASAHRWSKEQAGPGAPCSPCPLLCNAVLALVEELLLYL